MKNNEDSGPKRPGRLLITLPDDVREAIQRAAFVDSRSVTAEITRRLRWSIDGTTAPKASEPCPPYATALSDTEQQLLEAIRKLPHTKQLALLTLLK